MGLSLQPRQNVLWMRTVNQNFGRTFGKLKVATLIFVQALWTLVCS